MIRSEGMKSMRSKRKRGMRRKVAAKMGVSAWGVTPVYRFESGRTGTSTQVHAAFRKSLNKGIRENIDVLRALADW